MADHTWPVIHALLSYQDTVHYVHVGKTFSGSDVEAMVDNQDSLYFSDAEVYMDVREGEFRTHTVRLERIDTLIRDPGVLPPSPYTVYLTSEPLEALSVVIRVVIPSMNHYVRAGVNVRGAPCFTWPEQGGAKQLDFYEEYPVRIQWDGVKLVSETIIRLWYAEQTVNGIETKKLDWVWTDFDFILEPNRWFDLMLYSLKNNDRILARKFLSVDILASGGNWQWGEYVSRRDLVFDLISQPFASSTISGAYGFVGSRASGGLFGWSVDQEFLDSLSWSPRVAGLKFVNSGNSSNVMTYHLHHKP